MSQPWLIQPTICNHCAQFTCICDDDAAPYLTPPEDPGGYCGWCGDQGCTCSS